MKEKKPIILSLIAVVLAFMMVSCSSDNPFEAQPQNGSLDNAASLEKKGRKEVSIKGSIETNFQFIPLACVKDGVPVDCSVAGTIPVVVSTPGEGVGKVSHLGRLTISFEQTVDFTTTPPSLRGTDEFTAANGDKLFATHTGTSTGPDAQGNDAFTAEFIFTGGTGKFKGASGRATFTGVAHIPTGKAQFSVRGSIKLKKSDRDDDDDDDDN